MTSLKIQTPARNQLAYQASPLLSLPPSSNPDDGGTAYFPGKINTSGATIFREDLLHTRNETKMMASKIRLLDLSRRALSIDTWLGIHALRIPGRIFLENSSDRVGVLLSRWELFVGTGGWYCLSVKAADDHHHGRRRHRRRSSITLTHKQSISTPARGNWKCLQIRRHTMVPPVHQV